MKLRKHSNKFWKDAEVTVHWTPQWDETIRMEGTVEEMAQEVSSLSVLGGIRVVPRLRLGWTPEKGCFAVISPWQPWRCGGSPGIGDLRLSFRPWTNPYPSCGGVWYRTSNLPSPKPGSTTCKQGDWETHKMHKIAAGLDALCYIILQSPLRTLHIKSLESDLAADILYQHLLHAPNNKIQCLEVPVHDVRGQEVLLEQKRRCLWLCIKLIRNNSKSNNSCPNEIRAYGLNDCFQTEIFRFLQALHQGAATTSNGTATSNGPLHLDLKRHRFMDTRYRENEIEHKGRYMINSLEDEGEKGAPVQPLVRALQAPSCPIEKVNLAGIRLTQRSAHLLVRSMTSFQSLQNLSLRGTGLDESDLCTLFESGLSSSSSSEISNSLQELDVSWNPFTPKVLNACGKALVANTTLQLLKIEHCGIDLTMIQEFGSKFLPEIRGLRHLHLDGNDFTFSPVVRPDGTVLTIGQYASTDHDKAESTGAVSLVQAMERNYSLWSLHVGEYNQLSRQGRACCTSATYVEHMSLMTRFQLQNCLERNKQLHKEKQWSQMKQAVVRLANLLLRKLKEEEKQG